VAGCCEYGDEISGSVATDLVSEVKPAVESVQAEICPTSLLLRMA
jgi:hypothetical protein